MSRRSRSRHENREYRNVRTRDTHDIARDQRRFDPDFSDLSFDYAPTRGAVVEDRRYWSPYERSARYSDGTATRTRARLPSRRELARGRSLSHTYFSPTAQVVFDESKPVSVCERRSRRRRALFATRKAGRGGQRRPIWNAESYVQCKRRK